MRKETWAMKIDEAVAYLMYNLNIDVMRLLSGSEHKEVAKYFETVTRCLGEQAARQRQKTHLESFKK